MKNLKDELADLGYAHVQMLPSGEWAGIESMMFTTGLFVGLDRLGYRTRFCYPDRASAEAALKKWDGFGDPPGPWIKEKGEVDRPNPKSFADSLGD
jgi:hypothetical protein